MDPLTEKMLERARARRENLARKMAESNMSPCKSTARLPLGESQDTNREETTITSRLAASPVKVRMTEQTIKPDTPAIPSVKSRLQRLADQRQMWKGTDGMELDSPQNVIPPKRPDFGEEENVQPTAVDSSASNRCRSRFAALAASINSWEDDTNHPRQTFNKEKPVPRVWQPPQAAQPAVEPTPVPAKRSAHTAPVANSDGTGQRAGPSSSQPSPPKRAKLDEKDSSDKREPSGRGKASFKSIPYNQGVRPSHSISRYPSIKRSQHASRGKQHTPSNKSSSAQSTIITVQACKHSPLKKVDSPVSGRLFVAVGSRSDATSSSDDSDVGSSEQPVPAPRSAKTAVRGESPVKTHLSTTSPIKRPTLQSCTAATPTIQSPKRHAAAARSPEKMVRFNKPSPAKNNSPAKRSPTKQAHVPKTSPMKQAQFPKSSPVKQAFKPRGAAAARKGATSENFARARALLEQGCGGGGASAPGPGPAAVSKAAAPKVGAIAQRIQDSLKEHENSWQKNTINTKIQEERQKELALIRARFEGNGAQSQKTKPEPSYAEESPDDVEEEIGGQTEEETEDEEMEPEVLTSEDEDERSDSEGTAEEDEGDAGDNTGFIAITMEKSATPCDEETDVVPQEDAGDDSVNISDVLGDIDELIVEAEQAMQEEQRTKGAAQGASPHRPHPDASQADTSGWDFGTPKAEPVYDTIPARNRIPPLPEAEGARDNDAGRMPVAPQRGGDGRDRSASMDSCVSSSSSSTPHSLESYRSQQQKVRSPVPVTHRTVTRETASRQMVRGASTSSRDSMRSTASTSASSSGATRGSKGSKQQQQTGRGQAGPRKTSGRRMSTKEKIQMLMEEVSAQQSIIHQTSQALELIAATEEYHGTKEEIEAERLLVVSTQRRQACLSEIQHLKTPMGGPQPRVLVTADGETIEPCRGSVTLKDIRLPLKTSYLMALDSGKDQPHHSYFVIVRCQEHVIATQIMSTREISGDCLHFTNLVCLNDLGSDFTIELLVYEMRGRCATTDAVHSKKASTSKHGWSLTPKKFKSGASTFRQGGRLPQSPGPSGHSTVRQNSFAMVGSARLTLASCRLRKVTLTKIPFLSPLDGAIHLMISCHTDSQTHAEGFLTMFDDCSGLGMWHRRWCVLHGGNLSFWKYPGDEKRKPPIGTVDLKECITGEVCLISRIHCARPNTFELQTSRPAGSGERDTLVSRQNNSHVITKHLLSADTKEDRVEWTTALNKALLELRMWCNEAMRPMQE